MGYLANNLYHIYNRSINKEILFKEEQDYIRFLEMMKKHFSPTCELHGWCLMPNHFHFLVYTNEKSVELKKVGGLQLQLIQNGIKNLLSSYSKSYNFHQHRTGNLFQQKTKYKEILTDGIQVLHYIHQNPWKAGIVTKMEDWFFSSFNAFRDCREDSFCNLPLAFQLLGIQPHCFYAESYASVSNDLILKLGLDI